MLHKAKTKSIAYMMTWSWIVTKYPRSQVRELKNEMSVKAYIQSLIFRKKTLETINLERNRSIDER